LHIEDSLVGFDRRSLQEAGFKVLYAADGNVKRVGLASLGPKLLVSDFSTADKALLRWRVRVRGNTAVEFGVVPLSLTDEHLSLHKARSTQHPLQERAVGFCSHITAGSDLPIQAPVLCNSIVEIVARRGHVEYSITQPAVSKEVRWQNGQAVQRPYRGPQTMYFSHDFAPTYDVKLAITCWAKSAFDVIYSNAMECTTLPSSPVTVAIHSPQPSASAPAEVNVAQRQGPVAAKPLQTYAGVACADVADDASDAGRPAQPQYVQCDALQQQQQHDNQQQHQQHPEGVQQDQNSAAEQQPASPAASTSTESCGPAAATGAVQQDLAASFLAAQHEQQQQRPALSAGSTGVTQQLAAWSMGSDQQQLQQQPQLVDLPTAEQQAQLGTACIHMLHLDSEPQSFLPDLRNLRALSPEADASSQGSAPGSP
jgi:hypothetical protein